jgi:hypothetical protein
LADRLMDHNVLLGGIGLRQRLARVLEAFDDPTLNIDDYIFTEARPGLEVDDPGNHSKRILTYEPTGKQISISRLSAAISQNGKIVQHCSDDANRAGPAGGRLG